MNAPPFPTNPSVGQRNGMWIWNGARWLPAAPTPVQVLTTTFLANGVYMPSPGLVSVTVECIGGGGAGGAATSPNALWTLAGGGGGSGGYSRKTLPFALVAGGVVVTVGDGGAGDTNVTAPPLPGVHGGQTSFGALCVAAGGFGGWGNDAANVAGAAGAPAAQGIGDVAFPGAAGFNGIATVTQLSNGINASGGQGGWIFGGTVTTNTGDGTSLPGFSAIPGSGAGGTGGVVNRATVGVTVAGGSGASGAVIVTEYCFGDSGGDCDGAARVAITGCGPGWGEPC